jgi:hypothetical protein
VEELDGEVLRLSAGVSLDMSSSCVPGITVVGKLLAVGLSDTDARVEVASVSDTVSGDDAREGKDEDDVDDVDAGVSMEEGP